MKKVAMQGLMLVAVFFGILLTLRQVSWTTLFRTERVTETTEKKLGDLFWDLFKKTERESHSPAVIHAVDSLVSRICEKNHIDRSDVRVHVLMKDEVNAFALPNGHLILNSGLIAQADNEAELSGVICHELAHIELNHVMKTLVKEMGLSVLISMTTGSGGGEAIKEAAKLLSSSAFDRTLEEEADRKAIEYLVNAHINPEAFAGFMYKLADQEPDAMKYFSWISTHPESKERAAYIAEAIKDKKIKEEPVLSAATWNSLQDALKR